GMAEARTARLRGAERGKGVPASDEPGCGAEPHVSSRRDTHMRRREFLVGAAAAAGLARARPGWAQTRDPARLARVAIMSLSFNSILKTPNQSDAARTLDVMDLGEMFADRYGVHHVEMQHAHFPSTETAWLTDFRSRLARTKSQVTNINLEFGPQNISAADPELRRQAVDRTRQWIDYAVVL